MITYGSHALTQSIAPIKVTKKTFQITIIGCSRDDGVAVDGHLGHVGAFIEGTDTQICHTTGDSHRSQATAAKKSTPSYG